MTGDRPTTPGWHCHRCRSTSCRQRADSDTDHVGRVEYRPLLLTQPSSVSWLWSHTHWCPSQRPQEVMRVDGSANPTMPKNPAQQCSGTQRTPVNPGGGLAGSVRLARCTVGCGAPAQADAREVAPLCVAALRACPWLSDIDRARLSDERLAVRVASCGSCLESVLRPAG